MQIIIEQDKDIELRNGIKIKTDEDNRFPAMQNVKELNIDKENICSPEVCPIWEVCEGNNGFDCEVYEMFLGANFHLSDLIKVCGEARKYREIIKITEVGK